MKEFFYRKRNWFVFGLSMAIVVFLYATNPDGVATQTVAIVALLMGYLLLAFAHGARKALLDYTGFDLGELFAEAKKGNVAAAIACVAVSIFYFAAVFVFTVVFFAVMSNSAPAAPLDARTYIPQGAYTYAPQLREEQLKGWSEHPDPKYWLG